MEITIDGIKDLVEIEQVDDETLEQFMNNFKGFLTENHRIMKEVSIDSVAISSPFVDDIFAKKISEIAQLSILTTPIDELSIDALSEINNHINLSINDFKKASEIIYEQKYSDAVVLIQTAVQRWRKCQQAVDMIITLSVDRKNFDVATYTSHYKNLEEVIVQLSESISNSDYMMVKDVIDYELLDRLNESLQQLEALKELMVKG